MTDRPLHDFLAQVSRIVGKSHLLSSAEDNLAYSYDNSRRQHLPQAVVLPGSHEEILQLVRLCNEFKVPLVTRGRGTGTTGATTPIHGGLVLSTERMTQILDIDADNRVAVVQPGVTNQQLQTAAGELGFFWPPDPTSAAFCSIGGNLAYNSAGPRAIKYGTPRENTLGLKAISGRGQELQCGVYTTKGVVGYDLTRLLIGSEGTLAIITEATLKLTPLPQSKTTLQATYKDMVSASHAVSQIMAQAVTPCVLEFIDGNAINMIRSYTDCDIAENTGALLMIELDGQESTLPDAITSVRKAAHNEGLVELLTANNKEEVDALWAIRKALSPALRNVAPKKINEDVVVPVSQIPALISGLDQLSQTFGITIINFGHAGNGNIHVNLLVDPDDPQEMHRAELCLDQLFDLVINLRGTLSGEHGIGLEKKPFIDKELSPEMIALMQAIKHTFDPNNILNPGKMFPDPPNQRKI